MIFSTLQTVLGSISTTQDYLLRFFLVPVLIFSGVFLSFKIRWFHITGIGSAIRALFFTSSDNCKKNISSFAAFSAILGGNLGVGNISGTAIALATGGPGSIVWMAVVILFTSVIKYFSCNLGIRYRLKRQNRFIGGPMYFMQNGLKSNFLAVLFCVATASMAIFGGNLVQVNSLTLPMTYLEVKPIYGGLLIASIMGLVIVAGVKAFAKIVVSVVPFMAAAYLFLCALILISFRQNITSSIALIFSSAFDFKNAAGGLIGFAWLKLFSIVQIGASRGIFATDIGFGLEAILHSNVKQQKGHKLPLGVEQGLISVLSPFIVLVVCFITALVLMVTNVWDQGYQSTNMCFEAFRQGTGYNFAGSFLILVLFCFAFTTILTWSFCADRSIEYIFNHSKFAITVWRILFVLVMPLGSVIDVGRIWHLVDFSSSLMLLLNLFAVLILSRQVLQEVKSL